MTTQIAFGRASALGERLLALAADFDSETVAADATSTMVAPSLGGEAPLARIATDADVYVAFGATPDATAEPRLFCPANSVTYVFVAAGDKMAVKADA